MSNILKFSSFELIAVLSDTHIEIKHFPRVLSEKHFCWSYPEKASKSLNVQAI